MFIIECKEVESILRYFDTFSNTRMQEIKRSFLCSKKDEHGRYSKKRLYNSALLWDFLKRNYQSKLQALDVKTFDQLYNLLPLLRQERSFSKYPNPITIYD